MQRNAKFHMLSFFQINVPNINTYQLSRSNISITQKVCNDNRVYFKSTELKEKFSRCKAYEALTSANAVIQINITSTWEFKIY